MIIKKLVVMVVLGLCFHRSAVVNAAAAADDDDDDDDDESCKTHHFGCPLFWCLGALKLLVPLIFWRFYCLLCLCHVLLQVMMALCCRPDCRSVSVCHL